MFQRLQPHWIIEGKLSAYLDFIRWGAAVIVILSHIKGLFFADYSLVEHPSPVLQAFYVVASAGHQAVIVFFVLSGLFISANVMKTVEKKAWSWKVYLTNRLTRLYVVLLPALVLGCLWDILGILGFRSTGVYDGLPEDRYVLGFSAIGQLTPEAFFGNLFYLQGVLTGHFGSNGPLWSLSYEFWYYMLFPCLTLAFLSNAGMRKGLYGLGSLALLLLIGKAIALYFLVWLLGFAIHLLPERRLRHERAWTAVFMALSLASFFLYRLIPLNPYLADFAVALCFTGLVYFMKTAMRSEKASPRAASWSKTLAGFSYTAYLAHFPLLVFLHAALYRIHPAKWQPTALTFLYGTALLLVALAYCWLISFFTERRTDDVRRWILARVTRDQTFAAKPKGTAPVSES